MKRKKKKTCIEFYSFLSFFFPPLKSVIRGHARAPFWGIIQSAETVHLRIPCYSSINNLCTISDVLGICWEAALEKSLTKLPVTVHWYLISIWYLISTNIELCLMYYYENVHFWLTFNRFILDLNQFGARLIREISLLKPELIIPTVVL